MSGPERRGSERRQEAARPSTQPWGQFSGLQARRTNAVDSKAGSKPKKSLSATSYGLQSPPALPGKATRPLNCPGPGILAGLGLGRQISGQPAATFGAFCPSCRISMCRGAQLRGPRPGLCVGGGPTPSLRIPGACSGSPRPRAENAVGAHNPSCCNPQGWRHPGLSKNCVVSGLNSYLCVCHGSRGSRGGHKNNPKCFICFCTFLLQTTWLPVPAGSRGPARAQSYGAALSALFV